MNYSQLISTYSYNPFNMTTSESFDSSTEVTAVQPITQHQKSSQGNMMDMSGTSCDFATFDIAMQYQIISYLKFYYLSSNDNNFYYVTCKIILQEDSATFDDHNYNHGFFFQHPNDSSI